MTAVARRASLLICWFSCACGGGVVAAPPDACAGDACEKPPDGPTLWARRAGDGATQYGYAVAVDRAGNVIIGGEFAGQVDFGGAPITPAGTSLTNGYLAKYDASGRHLWSKRIGGSRGGDQTVHVVTLDRNDDIWVGGFFSEEIDCGGGPFASAGSTDAWIAKYDASGKHLFSARFGDAEPQAVSAIAVESDLGVVVAGDFGGSIDLGGGPLKSAGSEDVFVARFDPAGKHRWSKRYGADDNERRPRLAIDSKGAVIMAGTYRNQVDFGSGLLPDRFDGAFLLKLSPDGEHVWSKGFDANKYQFPAALAIDAADGFVMVGRFFGDADFGAGKLSAESGEDGFVASYEGDGRARWSRRFGGFGQDGVNGVAIDGRGDLLIAAEFTEKFEGLASHGLADLGIAKLDARGTTRWARSFGDTLDQRGMRVAAWPDGRSATVGSFFGVLDFGPGFRLQSNGGFNLSGGDLFVVVLGP